MGLARGPIGWAAHGLQSAEGLDGLVVGAADVDFVARDSFHFAGKGETVANLERHREGIVFEAGDAAETPPLMGDQLHLLKLGFGLRGPLLTKAGD